MGDLTVPVADGVLPLFAAIPTCDPPWPGVVVLHDAGGMTEDLRNQTRWLAREGFLAAAPNLFFRGARMRCLWSIARDLKARRGPTYDDVEAVRAWLIRQPGCTGKIAVIGFCMGGGFALLLVAGYRFHAASINYGGQLPTDANCLLERACPIVASYGARDPWNHGVAQSLEQLLTAAGVANDVKEYPEAGHSFLNQHDAWWFKALRVIHIAYDECAAQDARARIAAFLRLHLSA